ncbi:DNA-binding transcriptional regulator Cro [compost metagenome]
MKKSDVLAHFGGVSKVAEALGISPGAVSQWPEDLPPLRQLQLEELSGGKLKASKESRLFHQANKPAA